MRFPLPNRPAQPLPKMAWALYGRAAIALSTAIFLSQAAAASSSRNVLESLANVGVSREELLTQDLEHEYLAAAEAEQEAEGELLLRPLPILKRDSHQEFGPVRLKRKNACGNIFKSTPLAASRFTMIP